MLIGVVGLNGSGKDTFAQYLVDNHNFAHKDLGQEIRDELRRLGKNYLDRNEMIVLANDVRRKYGFNYWCKKAIESVRSKDLVITSIRNPAEIEEIKSHSGVIVEVFADRKVRFERTIARIKRDPTTHSAGSTFDEFVVMEEKELVNADPAKQQLLKCISMAEYRIDNNGSIERLDKEVEELFAKLKSK